MSEDDFPTYLEDVTYAVLWEMHAIVTMPGYVQDNRDANTREEAARLEVKRNVIREMERRRPSPKNTNGQ